MANRMIGRAERERRKGVVARWRRSGESAAEFAGRHGVSQWALYSWAKQLGGRRKAEPGQGHKLRGRRGSARPSTTAGAADFIPVRLLGDEHADPPVPADGVVEVVLRGGDVVRVVGKVSARRLRAVLTAVRQAC
jgi:transposase-like protein